VIAELERLGLVHSPHTSSGRIPTAQGYRLFIDNLLTIKPLPETEVRNVKQRISQESDTKGVFEAASSILSGITKLAGVVTLPTRQQTVLRQIEFIRISDDRVLAILVFSDRDIQTILREISSDSLVLALKGADEPLKEKIFKNMSKRASEMLRDDLEAKGPVRLSDVETAQKEILAVARRLAESGDISLGGSGGDEYI
jgi:flagellar motor switch protein FliG